MKPKMLWKVERIAIKFSDLNGDQASELMDRFSEDVYLHDDDDDDHLIGVLTVDCCYDNIIDFDFDIKDIEQETYIKDFFMQTIRTVYAEYLFETA